MARKFRDFYYGVRLRGVTADPSDNLNGSLWYNSTANRIKAYSQSAVRVMVTEDQTQTLTGKTIDGDDNTVQDIALASLKVDLGAADTFVTRDADGEVVSTLAVPAGDIVGSNDTQTLTNKTIDGDDNTIQDLSLSSIKTVGGSANTFLSRDGAGAVVSTKAVPSGTVVGTTDSQTLSAKKLWAGPDVVFVDPMDDTKQLSFNLSGSTTGIESNFNIESTDNRVWTLPDATTTLVGHNTTDTLTNKTIDGDANTIQDLALTSLKTDAPNANKFLSRDGDGIVVSTLAVPSGSIVGTTATQTLTNKTIDGDDNTLQDIAITSLKTDAGAANTFISRDGSGIIISTKAVPTGTVVGTSDTQTLTNKTLTAASTLVVDGSDPSKQIGFLASGATASTKLTLAAVQTANRTITFPDATDTLVGRATTDTLSNKTFSDALTIAQIATPSNPASGFNKLYFKTDDNLYYLTDGGDEVQVGTGMASTSSEPTLLENMSITASVAANAITFALKDEGGGDPSALSPVRIAFRDPTAATGSYNIRAISSALSFVVSSGSTLGQKDGVPEKTYIYAIDDGGTVRLGASTSPYWDETVLQDTTAEGGSGNADNRNLLYSASSDSALPIRLLGYVLTTQTTAGTWAASPTRVSSVNEQKFPSEPDLRFNQSVIFAPSAGSATVNLSTETGSAAAPSEGNPILIAFRSTVNSGGYVVRKLTAAPNNLVISSGSTLGQISGQPEITYIYAIDNAGTVEMAVSSSRMWDEAQLHNTTAEGGAGAADDRYTLYSTTARTGVAIRLVGIVRSTQATAGSWVTAPTYISSTISGSNYPTSEIIYDAGNGYGSTATRIRRWSNNVRTRGSAITYADSSTAGTTFTINEPGVYSITRTDQSSGTWFAGLTLNTNQTTTSIDSIGAPTNLGMFGNPGAIYDSLTVTLRLIPGDVIRGHDGSSSNPTSSDNTSVIRIRKISD